MSDTIYASIVIAFASFSQSVSGVGFVMVATPFLLSIMNVKEAVVIAFSMSIISQVIIVYKHWRTVHPQMFLNFVTGSALGAPMGVWFFSAVSPVALKLIVAMVLFSISSFSLYKICKSWNFLNLTTSYHISSDSPPAWNMKELLRCAAGRAGKVQLLVGSIAGFFGASIGMPGIPLTVYYSVVNVDKEVARSTTLSFFIVLLSATLAANCAAGTISESFYGLAPLLIPSVFVGMVIGNKAFTYISQRWFQLILNLIIFYSACRILADCF